MFTYTLIIIIVFHVKFVPSSALELELPTQPRTHYVLDSFEAQRLALLEQKIAAGLRVHDKPNEKEDLCFQSLSKFLHAFDQDTIAINFILENGDYNKTQNRTKGRAKIVVDNPILLLRMIRRNAVYLLNDTIHNCNKEDTLIIIQTLEEICENANIDPVTFEDVKDALEGMLRIHYVYGFNATRDLRLGILNGTQTKAKLDFEDCIALAEKAIEWEGEALAYQWLVAANITFQQEKSISFGESYQNILEQGWMKLMNYTNVTCMAQLQNRLENKRQSKLKYFQSYEEYDGCRGVSWTARSPKQNTSCYYLNHKWDPYFAISPVKVELLSNYPRILQFHELVGSAGMSLIRSSVAWGPERAQVIEDGKGLVNQHRTSMHSWVFDTEEFQPQQWQVKMNTLIEKVLKLNIIKEGSSNMQVAAYGSLGGHYDCHHDAV